MAILIELAVGITSSACSQYLCPLDKSRIATANTPSSLPSTSLTVDPSFCHSTCSFSRESCCATRALGVHTETAAAYAARIITLFRSEERRVGKECRSEWSPDHSK